MTEKNAARIYKKVELAHAEQERQKALSEPEAFIKLAEARGYTFTVKDLETSPAGEVHLHDWEWGPSGGLVGRRRGEIGQILRALLVAESR